MELSRLPKDIVESLVGDYVIDCEYELKSLKEKLEMAYKSLSADGEWLGPTVKSLERKICEMNGCIYAGKDIMRMLERRVSFLPTLPTEV
jgi:hypothetical protein